MSTITDRLRASANRRLTHWQSNRAVEQMARQVAQHAPPTGERRPVVFFNASTRLAGISLNAGFALLAAWAVRLQGVPVVQFVCQRGMSRCVLGTNRDDPSIPPPCSHCMAQSRHLFAQMDVRGFDYEADVHLKRALERLSVDELMDFTYQGLALGQLVLPSLRWILRRHHLSDGGPTRFLYRQYILSAWNVAREFTALLDQVEPQCVVVFNGMFYPEAVARQIALGRGIRAVTHEVGLQPYSAYFTTGEATAYPIDIPDDFELSPAQNARLDRYLEQRFQGNFSMAGIRFWPQMHGLSEAFLERAARFEQIVPVFTNVIFDTSQGHANVVFPHMFAWLDEVLEIARAHPATLFVIRAHPDEARPGKQSLESVSDWVARTGADRLPNVTFVPPEETISSYELIQRSKFVMVYNSTIGLEASLQGAAVLCGGKARFTQIPTVVFPATLQEYRRRAEEYLSAERVAVDPRFQRNARRFLYYQLFRTSLPFGDYLEEDGVWPGYVRLRSFTWEELLPERSPALRAILDGILHGGTFLLEEQPEAAGEAQPD